MTPTTTRPLYDQHRGAPVELFRNDISTKDIEVMCSALGWHFHSLGCPPGIGGNGWDDTTVMRVGTNQLPSHGLTIKLDLVHEWKLANDAIGEPIVSGGMYRDCAGKTFTTICKAKDLPNGGEVVVFRDDAGETFTRALDDFFTVIKHEGKLAPKFVFIGRSNTSLLS